MLAAMATCQNYESAKADLAAQYGELPAGMGLSQSGAVTQLFVGPESWTLVVVLPSGIACARDAGVGWQDIAPAELAGHRT